MTQSVKKLSNVHLQDPATAALHRLLPEALERLVGRSPGPKPVGTVMKVLFVDRLDQHHDRPLEDLILQGRNPDWASVATRAFRDVRASHGRCAVRAGLGAFQERPKVSLQVLLVVRSRLPVHAHRSILARTPICLVQPRQVEVLVQRSERHLRGLLRQPRYPLLSR